MKKIRKNIFPIFILLGGILTTGCQPSKSDHTSNAITQDAPSNRLKKTNTSTVKVKMSVDPKIYSLTEDQINIKCSITNTSSSAVQFGSAFIIEKRTDTLWAEEPFIDTVGFEDILYSIAPKQSKEFQVPLTKLLKNKNLSPGTYRISKKVWLVDQRKDSVAIYGVFQLADR